MTFQSVSVFISNYLSYITMSLENIQAVIRVLKAPDSLDIFSGFPNDQIYYSNETIFERAVKPLTKTFLTGINASVVSYGASSKKSTLFGEKGIFNYFIDYVFKEINEQYIITMSFSEISEDIHDLFDPSRTGLKIEEEFGSFVINSKSEAILNGSKALDLLQKGKSNRISENSTLMLRIHIEKQKNNNVEISNFFFLDLVDSESLSVLNIIVQNFVNNQKADFSFSKLAEALQTPINGNSRTLIIAHTDLENVEETSEIIKFSLNASKIQNKLSPNLLKPSTSFLNKYNLKEFKSKEQKSEHEKTDVSISKNSITEYCSTISEGVCETAKNLLSSFEEISKKFRDPTYEAFFETEPKSNFEEEANSSQIDENLLQTVEKQKIDLIRLEKHNQSLNALIAHYSEKLLKANYILEEERKAKLALEQSRSASDKNISCNLQEEYKLDTEIKKNLLERKISLENALRSKDAALQECRKRLREAEEELAEALSETLSERISSKQKEECKEEMHKKDLIMLTKKNDEIQAKLEEQLRRNISLREELDRSTKAQKGLEARYCELEKKLKQMGSLKDVLDWINDQLEDSLKLSLNKLDLNEDMSENCKKLIRQIGLLDHLLTQAQNKLIREQGEKRGLAGKLDQTITENQQLLKDLEVEKAEKAHILNKLQLVSKLNEDLQNEKQIKAKLNETTSEAQTNTIQDYIDLLVSALKESNESKNTITTKLNEIIQGLEEQHKNKRPDQHNIIAKSDRSKSQNRITPVMYIKAEWEKEMTIKGKDFTNAAQKIEELEKKNRQLFDELEMKRFLFLKINAEHQKIRKQFDEYIQKYGGNADVQSEEYKRKYTQAIQESKAMKENFKTIITELEEHTAKLDQKLDEMDNLRCNYQRQVKLCQAQAAEIHAISESLSNKQKIIESLQDVLKPTELELKEAKHDLKTLKELLNLSESKIERIMEEKTALLKQKTDLYDHSKIILNNFEKLSKSFHTLTQFKSNLEDSNKNTTKILQLSDYKLKQIETENIELIKSIEALKRSNDVHRFTIRANTRALEEMEALRESKLILEESLRLTQEKTEEYLREIRFYKQKKPSIQIGIQVSEPPSKTKCLKCRRNFDTLTLTVTNQEQRINKLKNELRVYIEAKTKLEKILKDKTPKELKLTQTELSQTWFIFENGSDTSTKIKCESCSDLTKTLHEVLSWLGKSKEANSEHLIDKIEKAELHRQEKRCECFQLKRVLEKISTEMDSCSFFIDAGDCGEADRVYSSVKFLVNQMLQVKKENKQLRNELDGLRSIEKGISRYESEREMQITDFEKEVVDFVFKLVDASVGCVSEERVKVEVREKECFVDLKKECDCGVLLEKLKSVGRILGRGNGEETRDLESLAGKIIAELKQLQEKNEEMKTHVIEQSRKFVEALNSIYRVMGIDPKGFDCLRTTIERVVRQIEGLKRKVLQLGTENEELRIQIAMATPLEDPEDDERKEFCPSCEFLTAKLEIARSDLETQYLSNKNLRNHITELENLNENMCIKFKLKEEMIGEEVEKIKKRWREVLGQGLANMKNFKSNRFNFEALSESNDD